MRRAECSYLLLFFGAGNSRCPPKFGKSVLFGYPAAFFKAAHRLPKTAKAGRELGTVKRARQH